MTDGGRPMDQRWIAIACFSDEEWQALVEAIGKPDWATAAQFATLEGRKANEAELEANISAWTADKDAYELMEDLQPRGVPAGVVQSAREMLDNDEHLKARGYYAYIEHPEPASPRTTARPSSSRRPRAASAPRPRCSASTRSTCAKRSWAWMTKGSRS